MRIGELKLQVRGIIETLGKSKDNRKTKLINNYTILQIHKGLNRLRYFKPFRGHELRARACICVGRRV